MDRDRLRRQTVMRLRASEAMTAALAAAEACSPSLGILVEDTMTSIDLVCGDYTLGTRDRLALIDEALLLIAFLKEVLGAARSVRPELIVEIVRRTNGLLRRYARLVQVERVSS